MQTFLPHGSFSDSAACLDRLRLGKQRVECLQILRTLRDGGGWSNHPAVRMWRGWERALWTYGEHVCRDKMFELTRLAGWLDLDLVLPPWFGDPDFHRAHRSNLLRKNPEHYGRFGWDVPADLPYVWPI